MPIKYLEYDTYRPQEYHIAPLVGAAIISGAAGLASTVFNNQSNTKAVEEYNRGQMELAKYQNEYNLEMWNRQNEYNLPINQMKRLQEAGLNPHLVYGNGATTQAGMPPTAATPNLKPKHYDYSGLSRMFDYIALARTQKDIDVADQQIKESQAREQNIREQTYGQGLSNKWLDASFDMRLDQVHYQVENEIENMLYKQINRGFLVDKGNLEVANLTQKLSNMIQEYANLCTQQHYTEAQIAYTWKQTHVADAMIQKIQQETDLSYEQAEMVYYQTMGQAIENDKKIFGMYMELAKNPITYGGIVGGVQSGRFGGWQDALQSAEAQGQSVLTPEQLRKNRRLNNHSYYPVRK